MNEYIKRKNLVDLVLSKLKYLGDARIMNEGDEKVLSEIDGYEKALNDVHELILDKDLIENIQPVNRGRWITKAEDYYKAWQDSGRSWDDMPYFVTGLKFACSNCFEQFDVNAEGVEKWRGCPLCLARMDGDTE